MTDEIVYLDDPDGRRLRVPKRHIGLAKVEGAVLTLVIAGTNERLTVSHPTHEDACTTLDRIFGKKPS